MKLLFFYGPPAVGKLTVARELSKLTECKVFHNHLTIDLVGSIFEWGTELFDKFLTKYRLELIEAAAQKNTNDLIFTYVYGGTTFDNIFIEKMTNLIHKHKGKVCFVQLSCTKKGLQKRIKNTSRKDHSKIKTVQMLNKVLQRYDVLRTIPDSKTLQIDTEKLSPKQSAQIIQKHYKLTLKRK